MKSREQRFTRMNTYAFCGGNINKVWVHMCEGERNYARYLVERYGYTVKLAIQRAFTHGFDEYPFDYRSNRAVCEERTMESFGFGL